MSSNHIYYVYELINPKTNTVFYVGKGKGERYLFHVKCSGENPHKDNIIKKLLSENLEPIYNFPYTNLDEETAYEKESELIQKYGRECDGGCLTNICIDNRPPISKKGRTLSEYTKHKMSVSRSGIPRSMETKKKISSTLKGRTFTEETIHKMKTAKRPVTSLETRQKRSEFMKEIWRKRREVNNRSQT